VAAERSFVTDDVARTLILGSQRDWTACFFTLSGENEGCTKPSKMILINKAESDTMELTIKKEKGLIEFTTSVR